MFDLLVSDVMEVASALMLGPEVTVSAAAILMSGANTGAAMIVREGRLVGIFTERDALFRVIARGRDPQSTRVADVMTPDPLTVAPDRTYGHALVIMQENGFRHVPVVKDGGPIGIVLSRNAMDPELEEFAAEANRREAFREER